MVITGANSGLGRAAAEKLAEAGAHVVLTARDEEKGTAAVRDITERFPEAKVELELLDLADLASVREFAARYPHDHIDVLMNNAGVMDLPLRRTADGFEMQFGTNHLGHFALTGLLLPKLGAASGVPRVVTVSSGMHRAGGLDLDDLNWERRSYNSWRAYGQSKLANLLFTSELHRRVQQAGGELLSVAAHPGYAGTNLQLVGGQMRGSVVRETVGRVANRLFSQSPLAGAWPQIYAAVMPRVSGDEYYGPRNGRTGPPARNSRSEAARDEESARRLWELSEELTGVTYDFTSLKP
ncbi:oxidoreductase [Salinactinospora qingdaonensis]|uniref:Oxidoreductase n=1 Tax=Salinactinospora qingdaonensis TaxID=702744 RepID=A0ABP7FCB7_9ACTN